MSAATIELWSCKPLRSLITERQCARNRARAREASKYKRGKEKASALVHLSGCLECPGVRGLSKAPTRVETAVQQKPTVAPPPRRGFARVRPGVPQKVYSIAEIQVLLAGTEAPGTRTGVRKALGRAGIAPVNPTAASRRARLYPKPEVDKWAARWTR